MPSKRSTTTTKENNSSSRSNIKDTNEKTTPTITKPVKGKKAVSIINKNELRNLLNSQEED